MKQWVCKKCGNPAVEIKLWINPNTKRTIKPLTDSIDQDEDTYCHECLAGGYGIKSVEVKEE